MAHSLALTFERGQDATGPWQQYHIYSYDLQPAGATLIGVCNCDTPAEAARVRQAFGRRADALVRRGPHSWQTPLVLRASDTSIAAMINSDAAIERVLARWGALAARWSAAREYARARLARQLTTDLAAVREALVPLRTLGARARAIALAGMRETLRAIANPLYREIIEMRTLSLARLFHSAAREVATHPERQLASALRRIGVPRTCANGWITKV